MANKAMNTITQALVDGTAVTIRGQHAQTGERGARYEVTTDGRVLYWGSQVAHLRGETCWIDTCGFETRTTLKVINAALAALERVSCHGQPRVYQSQHDLYLGDDRWSGDSRLVNGHDPELVRIEYHGSVVLVRPLLDDVREWLEEHTEGQWLGGALAVEPRYLDDLLTGLHNDLSHNAREDIEDPSAAQ